MNRENISSWLHREYMVLSRFVEGKAVAKILGYTENHIALLMEDGTIVKFLHLEDELIFEIEPAV